jgi:hypothetical protein
MTRYQLLKENEDTVYHFVKAGILTYKIIRDMEMFESFLVLEEEEKEMFNEIKYIILAEKYELKDKTVEQIIYQMKKEVK